MDEGLGNRVCTADLLSVVVFVLVFDSVDVAVLGIPMLIKSLLSILLYINGSFVCRKPNPSVKIDSNGKSIIS